MKNWWLCCALLAIGIPAVVAFKSNASSPRGTGLPDGPDGACTPVVLKQSIGRASDLVKLSGSFKLCEELAGDRLSYWPVGTIELTNASGQVGRAAFVAVDFEYPHGRRDTYSLALDDSLLETGFLKVGKTLSFAVNPPAKSRQLGGVGNSMPSVTGRVVFVEFADGTAVGPLPEKFKQNRASQLAALRSVESSYTRDGEPGFLKAIQAEFGLREVDFFLHGVAGTQRRDGTDRAFIELKSMIQKAELRAAGPRN